MKHHIAMFVAATLFLTLPLASQTQSSAAASAHVVPPLIHFSNIASDESGTPLAGQVRITFSLYASRQGGEPLWIETQKVQLDATGLYSVQLGATKTNGVPASLFASGEARWLGVQIGEQSEQPRVLLLSVPYALKAADAETIGGLPPSAFVLAAPTAAGASSGAAMTTESATTAVAPPVSGTGTASFVPLWLDGAGTLGNSVLFQTGSGGTAKVGINTTTPTTTLDIKGGATVRGPLALPAAAVATAAAGKNSQPQNFVTSVYNSSTPGAVNETFRWQSEPVGNNTSTPGGSLNLLFGQGAATPAETGFKLASNGQITFAAGQLFPGAGTITEVDAGTDLTGGGTGGAVTLNLNTAATDTRYSQLGTANQFVGSQSVTGNISATGQLISSVANGTAPLQVASSTQVPNLNASFLGGLPAGAFPILNASNTFAGIQTVNGAISLPATAGATVGTILQEGSVILHAAGEFSNIFVGAGSGNLSQTGLFNVGMGAVSLQSNTTGGLNTAVGFGSLLVNTTGIGNTALGDEALAANTIGVLNTAIGELAGNANVNGGGNIFIGASANPSAGLTNLNNAIVIGNGALVGESNALILGPSGANAVKVGIGTATPAALLDVVVGTTGNHAPIGQFGSTGLTDGNSMRTYNGTGITDVFTVGAANTFVTGSKTGDGGLRVNPGQSILFGDSALARMTIDASGNVKVTGNLSKGGGSFKIDHPLDPLNKYLYHSFVESPDMMNVYNGNIVTDRRGQAVITMPDYFEALNRDFRYQLTVIGQFAQAIVAHEIAHNKFVIKTSKPSVKVSWQVTGIRQDAYANAHRIPTEEAKPEGERGSYLHPDAFPNPEDEKAAVAKISVQ
jgi:hypothetical protein